MTGYACKQCGAEAHPTPDGILRTCEHTGTVVADMKATAYGVGGMDDKPSRLSQIVSLIIDMVTRK